MSRREYVRDLTREEIKSIARQQMAEKGTAGLSLNAISKQMEMTAPALYRYFASRDDLVTALIVDAYTDQGMPLPSDLSQPRHAYADRLRAVMLAFRRWVLAHPLDFQLIYGNPIPGYHAPTDVTLPAARRSMGVIIDILMDAQAAGALDTTSRRLAEDLSFLNAYPALREGELTQTPLPIAYIALTGWSRAHGLLMLEIFHHSVLMVNDQDRLYEDTVNSMIAEFGLHNGSA